ncbi:kinase-like domain-containing protein [Aspergillus pseudodeflectus]|uniref:non-specific serine/threonine protein kinase n=1 Tax=Aspergillus pseudodeflectus TaxID=176178 RepID=A0ABR4LAV9_9EURO
MCLAQTPEFQVVRHQFIQLHSHRSYNWKHIEKRPYKLSLNVYQLSVNNWLRMKMLQNSQSDRFVALKIINNRSSLDAYHERDIEEHISRQTPIHRGRGIIRTCLDSFEVTGPDGSHLCLAYEPMREPLWILQRRFVDQRLPLPIEKAYLLILLAGLDYLQSECRFVHTDLKLDNILMTFENEDILCNFIKEQITNQPMQYKTDPTSGRTIYRCHNDFGSLDWRELRKMLPKIVDFGLATRLESDSQGQLRSETADFYPIQPDYFSADIWNIGVLTHLAEMIALFGPPPKELLAKSEAMAGFSWSTPIMNETGRLCKNGREYFNGPFFKENGEFLFDNLIPQRNLEDSIRSLEHKERQAFLSFVTLALAWNLEDMRTASELMEHPFLNG